jgi:hypothetical protein
MLFAYGFGVLNCADCGVDHVTSAPQAAPFHAVVNEHVVMAVAAAGETEGDGEFDAVFVGVTGGVGMFDGVVVVVTVAVSVDERDDPVDEVCVGVVVTVGVGGEHATRTAEPAAPAAPDAPLPTYDTALLNTTGVDALTKLEPPAPPLKVQLDALRYAPPPPPQKPPPPPPPAFADDAAPALPVPPRAHPVPPATGAPAITPPFPPAPPAHGAVHTPPGCGAEMPPVAT